MMYYDDEPMEQDFYADDSQQPTQSTQEASQNSEPTDKPWDNHLWGYLIPCRDYYPREDFWKINPTIRVGRSSGNDIVLNSLKISNKHCEIEWDGKLENSLIKVLDLSSNGTFINGTKIGKGITSILRDGNEIGFGTWGSTKPEEDYRYIFRFNACGPPQEGLHAQYEIGHELGKGSFATVVSAIERATGETYAVKIIHRNKFKAKNQETLKMFLREISILEGLEHHNICRLKDAFFGETIYLVLEYIEGGDLLDHIVAHAGLSEEQTKYLTRQLCEALKYIHAKGIAHRDLKPENVLLTKDDPPILKVADFGLAKAVDSMTKFKTTCGTPCYLAPEVILRENQEEGYDELVDSWSVGVIVFCMMSNSSPFIEEETEDIRRRFQTRVIDWNLLTSDISPTARDFIRRLLENDPKLRMSCAAALEHPWLAQTSATPGIMYPMGAGIGHDPSVISMGNASGMTFGQGQAPDSYIHVDVDQGSGSQLITPVPGEFPSSQGPASQRRPIIRRAHELEDRDPEGFSQQLDLVIPGEGSRKNGKAPANGNVNGANENGRKRKGEAADMDEAESPLTPVPDGVDGDEGDSPGPSNRGGYQLRNTRKKQDVPVVKAPASKPRRK
ncbi:Pkinase-domain-containing protein [Schizopora paradoxa]|uniref:Pkinase-domain-containing protein n=1 Tax=Schizopora paradoxa TaxID=27342 RepID=A0A0H2RWQ0_9AGAM|nr:Pkinase-domain-containing protein [Schizopora paradoxa]